MLNRRSLFALAIATTGLMAFNLPQAQAQLTVIEANFDEVVAGARLTVGGGKDAAGIRPVEGRFRAFVQDEAEIVAGWDGNAIQFQDSVENAALRLLFETRDVDPITRGVLEISLEFRIDGGEGAPYSGAPLQVSLTAPTQGHFLVATILGSDGHICHTNRDTPPAHEGMARGEVIVPGTVYRLKLVVSLDSSTYDIEVLEKESGNVVSQAAAQKFIPIPELEHNGIGANLLNVYAGSPDFSQGLNPPITVTVDNIRMRHLEQP